LLLSIFTVDRRALVAQLAEQTDNNDELANQSTIHAITSVRTNIIRTPHLIIQGKKTCQTDNYLRARGDYLWHPDRQLFKAR
jgi:hypothetical protein